MIQGIGKYLFPSMNKSGDAASNECLGDVPFWTDAHLPPHDEEPRRTEILDYGQSGFLLHNVMSDNQCNFIIDMAEKQHFGKMMGYEKWYRNNERVIYEAKNIAERLYSKVEPFLKPITIEGRAMDCFISGLCQAGTWMPTRLNPRLRICRYPPGGHFSPHRDGYYAEGDERSLQTFMIYLNRDFEEGNTNFLNPDFGTVDRSVRVEAKPGNIVFQVEPETGMAIIFNHARLHEGKATSKGIKYILRTDIMFKRIEGDEDKALKMLEKAEGLEQMGRLEEAVEAYKKAYKLNPELENMQFKGSS